MRLSMSFENLHALILEILRSEYEQTKGVAISFEHFAHDILAPISRIDDPKVGDAYEILLQFVSEEDRKKGKEHAASSKDASIIMAATYLNRSRVAYIEGNLDLAWSYIADARFWNGVTCAARGIDSAYKQTVKETAKETKHGVAVKGAQARAKSFELLKKFAQDQACSNEPKLCGWKSRNHAVQTIKNSVLKYAKENEIKLSENQADRTIDNWLATMPDADHFFSKKKT